jgi:hypothetical protein
MNKIVIGVLALITIAWSYYQLQYPNLECGYSGSKPGLRLFFGRFRSGIVGDLLARMYPSQHLRQPLLQPLLFTSVFTPAG